MSPPSLPDHHRYELREILGKGSMGVVYKAWDRVEERPVALKTLRTDSADDLRRFEQEIRTLSRLRHEGIVLLHDLGRLGRSPFFTMDYLPGPSLAALLDEPPPDAAGIRWLVERALETLEALEYIHRQGVLHGDLKPSNILLAPRHPLAATAWSGASLRSNPDISVRLVDFGLARTLRRRGATDRGGTLLYMSPEQADGTEIDERSDLYSLGALLYHLATGEPPYRRLEEALSPSRSPRPADEVHPACPRELAAVLTDLIAHSPDRRPATAQEAATRLAPSVSRRRRGPVRPRLLPPVFVERHSELELLRAAALRARSGDGHTLRIVGGPGSGKSWLLHRSAWKSEVMLDHGMVFCSGAFRRSGRPLGALREVFAGLLEALGPDLPARTDEASRDFLASLELTTTTPTEPSGEPPSEPPGRPPGEGPGAASPDVLRERALGGAVDVVITAARERPLVLALEDTQEASDFETELVARLERAVEGQPALLVLTGSPAETASPEAPPDRGSPASPGHPTSIRLEGLTDRELAALVENSVAPRASPSEDLARFLRDRGGASPLEVRHWLRILLERDLLRLESGEWTPSRDLEGTDYRDERFEPESLAPAERAVLATIALHGAPVDPDTLADLLEHSVDAPLRRLTTVGWIVPTPDGHALAPGVDPARAASGLSEQRRGEVHRWFARRMTSRPAPLDGGTHLRIAAHLEAAGDDELAADHYHDGGRAAARVFANRQAIDALRSCLRLTKRRRALRAKELGDLLLLVGDPDGALEELRRAAREADSDPSTDPDLRLEIDDEIGRALHRRGDLDAAETIFRGGVERSRPGTEARARAWLRLGGVAFDRGDLQGAREHYEQSLAESTPTETSAILAAAHQGLGLVARREERWSVAVSSFRRALEAATRAGRELEAATILNNLGNALREQGDTDAAIDCLRRSADARDRSGDRQGTAICRNNMARIRCQQGRFAEAADETREALRAFEAIGDRKGILITCCNLGEIDGRLGNLDAARGTLERGERLAAEAGAGATVLRWILLANLARVELEAGASGEAESRLRGLLAALPADKLTELRGQVGARLAEALTEEGRLSEAAEVLDAAEPSGESFAARARCLRRQGFPDRAARVAREALREEMLRDRFDRARVERELAAAYRDLGPDQADRTEKHFSHALAEFEAMRCPLEAAETHAEFGGYWRFVGEEDLAEDLWSRAEEVFAAGGLPLRVERVQRLRLTT